MKDRAKKINYCTHSNLNDLSFGGSNNDNKFIVSIPSKFKINKVFPNRNKDNSVSILNSLKVVLKLVALSTKPHQIFVIRGTRPGFIPILLKKFMKHKIVLNMGCTPFSTIERRAFNKNLSYKIKNNILTKIFLKLEFQFEKLLVRKADIIFVENVQARMIVSKFGGDSSKFVLIPYYVQKYFLTTKNIPYELKNGDPLIIGYTGRFHKYDKLEPLIDAIKILKEKGFPIILKLIGDGPTKIENQKKVMYLDLKDEIIFLGSQKHQNVSKIIDTEHVLVLPMVKNICPSTIPIKMLEGVIKGKIILTNNSGNIKSLFNPYYDLVLEDFSDPNLIAEKLVEISNNYEKFHINAQELRDRHLQKHNQTFFQNQIEKTLIHLK